MRSAALLMTCMLVATTGAVIAPGNGNGGPPGEFPGQGDFPGNPPPLPGEACDHIQNYPPDSVPDWVNLPMCAE